MLIGVAVTTPAWLLVTYLTPPDNDETLRRFYRLVHPGGRGWKPVLDKAAADGAPLDNVGTTSGIGVAIQCMLAGCFGISLRAK